MAIWVNDIPEGSSFVQVNTGISMLCRHSYLSSLDSINTQDFMMDRSIKKMSIKNKGEVTIRL